MRRALLPSTVLTLLAALLPASPATAADESLLRCVPAQTTSVWHRRPDASSALLDGYALDVVDAIAAARFDELLLEVLTQAGADPDLLAELASMRNRLLSALAIVPWRDLVTHEFVHAQTLSPAWMPDLGLPSMVLAVRPEPDELAGLERALSGMLGSLTNLSPLHLRYDIERRDGPGGVPLTLHRVVLPANPDVPLVDVAFCDGVLLAGLGRRYFEETLALLQGAPGERLAETARFRRAFAGLPEDVVGRRYLDVGRLRVEVADVAELLVGREFGAGPLQGLLGEALQLVGEVDTVASTTQCRGNRLVSETLTRFAPAVPIPAGVPGEAPQPVPQDDGEPAASLAADGGSVPRPRDASGIAAEDTPHHRTLEDQPGEQAPRGTSAPRTAPPAPPRPSPRLALAGAASGELLGYVPAESLAFTMRGPLDLRPLYRHARERLSWNSPAVERLLWGLDVLQAAVDLSFERDVLSWLGSEHVSITLPSKARHPRPGDTDQVMLCRLDDPDGARRFLARLEAVCHAAAPRLVGGVQDWLARVGSPVGFDLRLVPAEGLFRSLRRVELELPGLPLPFQPPAITFGVVGRLLVFSTSSGALEACMAVAAGEAPGLEEHPVASALLGRADLTSARLARRGREVEEALGVVTTLEGLAGALLGSLPEGEAVTRARETCAQVCERVRRVVAAFDFLGDEVVAGESREGGLARYERSIQVLLLPDQRPHHRPPRGDPR